MVCSHHMGMLGLPKGQISSSIHLCSCALFCIVGGVHCLLVPGSGVGVGGLVGC